MSQLTEYKNRATIMPAVKARCQAYANNIVDDEWRYTVEVLPNGSARVEIRHRKIDLAAIYAGRTQPGEIIGYL